jgi:hypothetical protein
MCADAVDALAEAGQTAPALLLIHDRLMSEVPAHAAVGFGDIRAQKAIATGREPNRAIDMMLFAPAGVVRHHLGFDET